MRHDTQESCAHRRRNHYIALMNRLIQSIPLLYVVMFLPGYTAFLDVYTREWYYPQMMHTSGVWSVRLLVLTLAVSPMLSVIRALGHGKAFGRWLLPRRRHFGLASAAFAFVHLVHYVLHAEELADIWIEAFDLAFLTGWVALLIYTALTVTSNGVSVRKMGRGWKRLHLLVYPSSAIIFWHWYLFDFQIGRVGFWIGLCCALKLTQWGLDFWRRRVSRDPKSTPAAEIPS